MAPNSSMKVDSYRLVTQDFVDAINNNPTLAGIEGLRASAKGSLRVARLILTKGEDDASCVRLLQKLLSLMENVYRTFRTTRTEILLQHKTIKTTKDYLSILESLLSDIQKEFEDNGIPVVPAVFADLEQQIDEARDDLESVRKTLARRETRAFTTSPDEETFQPPAPENKPRSKASRRSGAEVDSSPLTTSAKEKTKPRTSPSIPSSNVKKSSSYGTRRDTASRKSMHWLETASPVESGEEEHGGYESPEEQKKPEPRKPAGHSQNQNTNKGREAHQVPPHQHMYGEIPHNSYPGYYPQHHEPPRASTMPSDSYYHPQHPPYPNPSIDTYGLAMLFSQMRTQGGGGELNVNSGNITDNVYENVGNHIVEYRDTGRRKSRKSGSSKVVEVVE